MIRYRLCSAVIEDGNVSLPDKAIPLSTGLAITSSLTDEAQMRDVVRYLLPLEMADDS